MRLASHWRRERRSAELRGGAARHEGGVAARRALGRDLPGEPVEHPLPARRAEAGPQPGVVEQAGMAMARAPGSSGGTSNPVSPSRPTTSGSAPPVVATTGTPQAMASTAGSENPS